jgi:hypothetical protein
VRDGGLLLGGHSEPKSLNGDPRSDPVERCSRRPVVTDTPVLDAFENSFTGLYPHRSRGPTELGRRGLAHVHAGWALHHRRGTSGCRVS